VIRSAQSPTPGIRRGRAVAWRTLLRRWQANVTDAPKRTGPMPALTVDAFLRWLREWRGDNSVCPLAVPCGDVNEDDACVPYAVAFSRASRSPGSVFVLGVSFAALERHAEYFESFVLRRSGGPQVVADLVRHFEPGAAWSHWAPLSLADLERFFFVVSALRCIVQRNRLLAGMRPPHSTDCARRRISRAASTSA
jgi:hypothetical protein